MSPDIVPMCLGTSFYLMMAVGLVVPSRIEGEPTDQLPVFAQHPDVEVGHEHEHPGADEPTP
jgi:hypothetical protein